MAEELYDYRKYDQVWQRVSPQENPYPEARAAAQSEGGGTEVGVPMPMCRTLLQEELRHIQALLRMMENALA